MNKLWNIQPNDLNIEYWLEYCIINVIWWWSIESLMKATRSHTPGQKTAGFAGLVQRSDSRFPFEAVAKEPLSTATLLLLAALPWDGFFENGTSGENGLLLPVFPRSEWTFSREQRPLPRGKRTFHDAKQFRIQLFPRRAVNGFLVKLSWCSLSRMKWFWIRPFLRWGFGRATMWLSRWSFLLVRWAFPEAKRFLRWAFRKGLMRTSFFSPSLPTGSSEMILQTKHLTAFVYAAAWELRLHLKRSDFGLGNGESMFSFFTRWYFRWRCIL